MAATWNPKNSLKYIKMRLDSEGTRKRFRDDPYRDLRAAVDTGGVPLFGQFRCLGQWFADVGVNQLYNNLEKGLEPLHQSVYFQLADMHIMAARHLAFRKSAGHICEFDVALYLARAVTLGCMPEAHKFAELLWSAPGVMYLTPPLTRTPAYLFNLYSQWARLPLPDQLSGIEIKPPYASLIELWQSNDLELLRQALLAACDFHIARSREHNNREYFEF